MMADAQVCATPGCYETAYGGELCDKCLDGKTPNKRGPVTMREALYARIFRALDRGVTAGRLEANGQSTEILEIDFRVESPEADGQSIKDVTASVTRKLFEYFDSHPNELKTMNRRLFEQFIADLFRGFNYDVELTQATRDGGIDIIAIGGTHGIKGKYLIQCKRPDPENPVGVSVVRELYGIKMAEKATMGIVVTTTRFSRAAHEFQEQNQWDLQLVAFDELKSWIASYLEAQRISPKSASSPSIRS